jgi:MFS family permease
LIAGPISGFLSDRFGYRLFATAGALAFSASFIGLIFLPINFSYWVFALLIALNGAGSGMFQAPNTASVMGSVPAASRGATGGMRSTFQNAGSSLSIGVFFSLLIAGLAGTLSSTLTAGLQQHGVPSGIAHQAGSLPPVATVFSAFLGVNPIQHLLAPSGVLSTLSPANASTLTGQQFFPHLIEAPFHHGLVIVFSVAAILSLIAALASLLRGRAVPPAAVVVVETDA